MKRSLPFLTVLLVILSCNRQPIDLEAAVFLFQQNKLDEALPLFEELTRREPENVNALAYLAETYRRFGRKEDAVGTAHRALAIDPCQPFAHCVLAEVMNPVTGNWSGANADSTWEHLLKATVCDPKDGNPWLTIWGESIRRGEADMTATAAEKMMENGFFTKAMLAYTEWVLTALPPHAILITNGDMDTYPVAAIQEVERLRDDVVLVNRGTLALPWYARYIRDVKGVPLPFTDKGLDALTERKDDAGMITTRSDDIIEGWIEMWLSGKIRNPIAFANTTPEPYMDHFKKPLRYCGAYTLVVKEEIDRPDASAIHAALDRFTPDDFFGPWVSDQDRSPVRRVGTKNIVRNVTHAALTLAEQSALGGDQQEFERWLGFAQALDNGSALGPVSADRMRQLREKGVTGGR
jgi:hypothetical protein